MSLLEPRHVYKPFKYPWCFEAWEIQQSLHWLPKEVPLADDVKDWRTKLTTSERNLVTQIFRFFTQSDIEVNNCYMKQYSRVFGPTEVQMMLGAFSNMETIHIAAYSHLLDTIGIPEVEYEAFLKYTEMKEKYDYLQQFSCDTKEGLVRTMAVYGAFTEGLQLFASFAILLNFPRFNKMKGMGQIVTWSVRDETLHTQSIIKLYHTFLAENPELNTQELHDELVAECHQVVKNEDKFIDLAFEMGDMEGLTASEVKQYIRYIADIRLEELGLPKQFFIDKNPLPWLDVILNGVEHTNFFEGRATEYARAATQGDWEDVFEPESFNNDMLADENGNISH